MARNEKGNVVLEEGFEQVCVWPAVVVKEEQLTDFVEFFRDEMGVRVQYLEQLNTKPDQNEFGSPVEGTGGRNDVLFAVHKEDTMKFAVPRLSMGIRWIEDVYGNGHGHLYDSRVAEYKTW